MTNLVKLSESWTGLCNQLFAFTHGVLRYKKGSVVLIGNFSPEINSKSSIAISHVIDLEQTGKRIERVLQEQTAALPGKSAFRWYPKDAKQFNSVLRGIVFRGELQQIADEHFVTNVEKLNVVHLRIEPDAIRHWSKQNGLSQDAFTISLLNVYRKAIKKHIPAGESLLVLTADTSHLFIEELRRTHSVLFCDPTATLKERLGLAGREVCAIVDLLLGERCNGVFIGCHNFTVSRGSTFSYVLWQRMKNVKKGCFIDLDCVKNGVQTIKR